MALDQSMDGRLVEAHLGGDRDAMTELVARHRAPLLHWLQARAGAEAEDTYQEVWARAAAALPTYEDRGSFRAWLFSIARRQMIDRQRRRGARIELVWDGGLEPADETSSPESALATRQAAEALKAALAGLTPEIAGVVRLRLLEDVPFAEIARREGIPLNTALSRMHRGLLRLRAELESRGLVATIPSSSHAHFLSKAEVR